MGEVRWLREDEERAWRALQLMEMQLTSRMSRDLGASSSLSYPDYVVLAVLTAQPDSRMRILELAREIGWEKSRLSHHLNRMVARGLLAKERCESDRRGAYVLVSARGLSEIAAAAPSHVATVRRFFIDRLAPGQLEVIAVVAEQVLEGLAAAEVHDALART